MKGKLIVMGVAAAPGIAVGPAHVVTSPSMISSAPKGSVLVSSFNFVEEQDQWLQNMVAFVTNTGGKTAHQAVLAHKIGVPCVAGTGGTPPNFDEATKVIASGQMIVVDGNEGKVYEYDGSAPQASEMSQQKPVSQSQEMKSKAAALLAKYGAKK